MSKIIKYEKKYPIEDILEIAKTYIGKNKLESLVDIDGDLIKMCSQRLSLFYLKGVQCVHCGATGQYFRKCKGSPREKRPHLNLYGIDSIGREILFTKDHILPKVLGGTNSIDNYQVLCGPCNTKKGDKYSVFAFGDFYIERRNKKYHLYKKDKLLYSEVNAGIILMRLNAELKV